MNTFIKKLARRSPKAKSVISRLVASHRFHTVSGLEFRKTADSLAGAWQDSAIPRKQRKIVEPDLAAYREGKPVPTFDALVNILAHNIPRLSEKTLLEIGCSSGYYSEVLGLRHVGVCYVGCDYSPAFVQLAREFYPSVRFDVEDTTALTYGSGTFDIVISGCCLLHIADYKKGIAEAARVSREFVIFHRTPVLHLAATKVYTKKAYGVEVLEIHFNEQQLARSFSTFGLEIVDVNTQLSIPEPRCAENLFYKTYLCRKRHLAS